MVKISIIVPIYNVEKYLKDCLNAILSQTMSLEEIEVIMVDDASTDSSRDIMDEYAKKYSNFKAIKLPSKSGFAGKPRNEGIKIATGKYLMFTDPDDFYSNNACEVMYNAIEKYNADFITANYINTDENGKVWAKPIFSLEKYNDFKLDINDYKDTFFVMCSSVCNKIFNREFVIKNDIKFLHGVPAEDAYFSMSSFLITNNAYYIKDIIYNYRQRNKRNLSASFYCSLEYFRAMNKSYKEIYEKFKSYNQLGYYRYFYAKSISYMLCKFIDTDLLTDEERITYFKEKEWFYALTKELEVYATHKTLNSLVQKICDKKYKEAIIECKEIKEGRKLLNKDVRDRISKPTQEMYEELSKLDYKYQNNMYKNTFARTYEGRIFIENNTQPIFEDYFALNNNIFCIADGVTRDSINGDRLSYPQTLEELEFWMKNYPNPSGAYAAAKICADSFLKYILEHKFTDINEDTLLNIVKKVNSDIWKINKDRKIDYLKEDLYCCVATGGVILKDYLICFIIGDCHITLLDENFNKIFTTKNNHKQFENYIEQIYSKNNKFDWNNPNDRVMARKKFRNNLIQKYEGQDISFGVLTGEKNAENYIDTYKINLENVKYICAYSDGSEEYFKNVATVRQLIDNPEIIKNSLKETTLVIYERK